MKNEKQELCPTDSCLTASGGDFNLTPQAVKKSARRAQIPFLLYNLSFIIYNFLFSDKLLGPRPLKDRRRQQ